MEIDLLKKTNCDLEVHIETPKRINNQDKKNNEIQLSLKPITEAQKLD